MKLAEIRRLLREPDQKTVAEGPSKPDLIPFGLGTIPVVGSPSYESIEVDLTTLGGDPSRVIDVLSAALTRLGWNPSLVSIEKDQDILRDQDEYRLKLDDGSSVVATHPRFGVIAFEIPRRAMPIDIKVAISTEASGDDIERIKIEVERALRSGAPIALKPGEHIEIIPPEVVPDFAPPADPPMSIEAIHEFARRFGEHTHLSG